MLRRVVPLVVFLALLLTACGQAKAPKTAFAPKDSAVLTVGYVNLLDFAPAIIADKEGLFAKEGLNVQTVAFTNGPALYKALVAGQVDVAYAGIPQTAAWVSRGLPVKVVAKVDVGHWALIARPDANIRSVADLRGKTVGNGPQGSGIDLLIRGFLLPEAGLKPGQDVHLVESVQANMLAGLAAKKLDAAVVGEPFLTTARLRGDVVVKQLPDPGLVVIVRQATLDQHRDLVKKVLQAHAEAIRLLNQEPQRMDQVLAGSFSLPQLTVNGKTFTPLAILAEAHRQLRYEDRFTQADLAFYDQVMEAAVRLGYAAKKPETAQLFDLSLLPGAGQ